jgi:hypothetical protein
MKNAPLQLSPGGYSNWQIVMINAGNDQGFFVSPAGDSN